MKYTKERDPHSKFLITVPPMIIYRHDTYKKMLYLVDSSPQEVMWYNTISKTISKEGVTVYTIEDIFIPGQTVADKEVEEDKFSIKDMIDNLVNHRKLSKLEAMNLLCLPRCWGHSHVNMEPKPSDVDEKEWYEKKEQTKKDLIANPNAPTLYAMVIFNKKQEYSNRVYDLTNGIDKPIEYHNLNIYVEDVVDYSEIDLALTDKRIKKKSYEVKSTTIPSYPSGTQTTAYPGTKYPIQYPIQATTKDGIATTTKNQTFSFGFSNLIVEWVEPVSTSVKSDTSISGISSTDSLDSIVGKINKLTNPTSETITDIVKRFVNKFAEVYKHKIVTVEKYIPYIFRLSTALNAYERTQSSDYIKLKVDLLTILGSTFSDKETDTIIEEYIVDETISLTEFIILFNIVKKFIDDKQLVEGQAELRKYIDERIKINSALGDSI